MSTKLPLPTVLRRVKAIPQSKARVFLKALRGWVALSRYLVDNKRKLTEEDYLIFMILEIQYRDSPPRQDILKRLWNKYRGMRDERQFGELMAFAYIREFNDEDDGDIDE